MEWDEFLTLEEKEQMDNLMKKAEESNLVICQE